MKNLFRSVNRLKNYRVIVSNIVQLILIIIILFEILSEEC